jgi:hypothetical protein
MLTRNFSRRKITDRDPIEVRVLRRPIRIIPEDKLPGPVHVHEITFALILWEDIVLIPKVRDVKDLSKDNDKHSHQHKEIRIVQENDGYRITDCSKSFKIPEITVKLAKSEYPSNDVDRNWPCVVFRVLDQPDAGNNCAHKCR